jgi:HTH-type transcriptional regulator/antitoxin HigA
MMDVRPIKTQADYEWTLAQITQYFESEPKAGTPDASRFEVLLALIGEYEDRVFPIEAPDPIDAIKEVMTRKSYRQSDLAQLLGSRSRASELLARKRPLTLDQAVKLHLEWKIPAEALLRQAG